MDRNISAKQPTTSYKRRQLQLRGKENATTDARHHDSNALRHATVTLKTKRKTSKRAPSGK